MAFCYREVGIEGVDKLAWYTGDDWSFYYVLKDWKNHKEYFFEHMTKFDTIVQAGGHCGMYPRFYGNYFSNVYTFEPNKRSFNLLDKNCVDNDATAYHKFNTGLGAEESTTAFLDDTCRDNTGKHNIVDGKVGKHKIITLDSLDLPSCDVIHLDVEGYEVPALQGAENTINKFNPLIILETCFDKDAAVAHMATLGYDPVIELKNDTVFLPKQA